MFINAGSLFETSDSVNSIDIVAAASQSGLDFKRWIEITRKSHPGHALEADLGDRIDVLRAIIQSYIDDNYNLCIGLSGKDSLVLLSNVVNVLAERKQQGLPDVRLDVFHSDTKVDSIVMSNVIHDLSNQLMAYAKLHELELHYNVAQPSLTSDLLVGILGGRTLPTTVANRSRKCAVDVKVTPIKRLQKKIVKANKKIGKKTVMLLGKYYLESQERERRMIANKESFQPIEINDQMVASPLCFWAIYDVFEYLHRATKYDTVANSATSNPIPVFGDFTAIKEAYSEMSGGCSMSIINEGQNPSKPCDARSGCHQCCASGVTDHSMQNLLTNNPYLKPLNLIRNYLYYHRNNPAKRVWVARTFKEVDGNVLGKLGPNSYTAEHCNTLFKYYLSAQFNEIDEAEKLGIEPRFTVLELDQIIAIGLNQERYGLASGWEVVALAYALLEYPELRELPEDIHQSELDRYLSIKPSEILKQHGLDTDEIILNDELTQQYFSDFTGTRDVLEAVVDIENLHYDTSSDRHVRAVDTNDQGEFSIDTESEPWMLEQELLHHSREFLAARRRGHSYQSLFHVLTRLGILTFNNKGAAASWDKMNRIGNIFINTYNDDTSDPARVKDILGC